MVIVFFGLRAYRHGVYWASYLWRYLETFLLGAGLNYGQLGPWDLQANNAQVFLRTLGGTKHAQMSLQNTGGPELAQTSLQRRRLTLPPDQADHESAILTLI